MEMQLPYELEQERNPTTHRPQSAPVNGPDQSPAPPKDFPLATSRPLELKEQCLNSFDLDLAIPSSSTQSFGALLKNAQVLIKANDYLAAHDILRFLIELDPNNCDAIQLMGLCLSKQKKTTEALTYYLCLVRIKKNMITLSLVAGMYYQLGEDLEAKRYYLEALDQLDPWDDALFDIYKNIGNIALRQGDIDAAEEYYNRAYTIDSRSDVLYVNFGTLEIQRENYEKALENFRTALILNASNDQAWVGLALIHHQMGDDELALANIERSLDLNPNNETALKLYGTWGQQGWRLPKVILRLQDYLVDHDQNSEVAFLLAQALTTAGRFAEATMELERALTLNPTLVGGFELSKLLKIKRKLSK